MLFCSVVMRLNFTSFFYYSQTFVTFCKKKRVICVDRSVARSVSYRFITTKTRFPSEVNQCGIIGGQNDTETVFSPSTLLFPRQRYSLKAPFWRHIISVAYRVVISTFKRVFVLSIFTQSFIIQNFTLFLYTYKIVHTQIYTYLYISFLPCPGYLDLTVAAVSEQCPFYNHHLSSTRYKDVLISQGDVRPLGITLMIRLKDYALPTSYCK